MNQNHVSIKSFCQFINQNSIREPTINPRSIIYELINKMFSKESSGRKHHRRKQLEFMIQFLYITLFL